MKSDRQSIRHWAHNLLIEPERLRILDTETTGLRIGEIVQIAVIDGNGALLLDTLLKPSHPIPADATRIHGITDAMVADAPNWFDVSLRVVGLIAGADVVVYNAEYDSDMMHQTTHRAGMSPVSWTKIARWHCAMESYAMFYGEWNQYRQSYRWQKLTDACRQQGIAELGAPAHSALGDCLRTLALLRAMAQGAEVPTTE